MVDEPSRSVVSGDSHVQWLRAIGRTVCTGASDRQAAIVAHVGPDIEASPSASARRLIDAGASFDWVAFTPDDISLWEAHVGLVMIEPGTANVGIHVVDSCPPAVRAAALHIGREWAGETRSDIVHEAQFNQPFTVGEPEADRRAIEAVTQLCVDFAATLSA